MFVQDFNEFSKWIKDYTHRKRHALRLTLAIKLADMKQQAYNKRYFVILSSNDKLISVHNNDIDWMKRTRRYSPAQLRKIRQVLIDNIETQRKEGSTPDELYTLSIIQERTLLSMKRERLLPKNVDSIKLKKAAFYYTPLTRNNDETMTMAERLDAKKRYQIYAKKYLR